MTTILISFIVAFAVAIVATRLSMVLAWKVGAIDAPDGLRKRHSQATPRLGGVAIAVAAAVPIAALVYFPGFSQVSKSLAGQGMALAGLLVCGTMAVVVGAIDDVMGLRARWKFLWQVVIAVIAYAFGFSIKALTNPFGDAIYFGIFSFPITVFWFVACMNAVNLLDGLDGLAAGASLFVLLTLFMLSIQFNNMLAMLLTATVAGSILGFLVFNFPPARIFLGDSGSILLGFLVAALSIIGTNRKAEAAVALFVPIVALGVPILDTSLAILRRWYKRLPIASPDRGHIHHVLVSMGYSHRRVVLTLYGFCVLLGGAALLLVVKRNEVVILVVGALIVMSFVSARIFSGVSLTNVLAKLSNDKLRKEELVRSEMVLERAAEDIKRSRDLDAVWKVCAAAFKDIGYDLLRLEIDGQAFSREWTRLRKEAPARQARLGQEAPVQQGTRQTIQDLTAGGNVNLGIPFEPSTMTPDQWCVWLSLRVDGQIVGRLTACRSSAAGLIKPEVGDILNRFRSELEQALIKLCQQSRLPANVANDRK